MIKGLKKYIPSRETVENYKMLSFLSRHFRGRDYLWEFNQSTVTRATWIGVFWAIMPMPLQMLPAVFFSILLRGNVLVAIAWVWISNPFTMLPILYASYYLGCHTLGIEFSANAVSANIHHLASNWHLILLPLVLGAIILGIIASLLSSLLVWLGYQIFTPSRK
ncbi:MAG: DUF2062 domain-containing protein [Burkholderiales bacterium]|jgi:hypothetical protein|nr:DUF2062 domain-containing protein [Burkholderiales bacterium]